MSITLIDGMVWGISRQTKCGVEDYGLNRWVSFYYNFFVNVYYFTEEGDKAIT